LDTIRRQNQQLKLLQQILDKVEGVYSNPSANNSNNSLARISVAQLRREAIWDEDTQKWLLTDHHETGSGSVARLPSSGLKSKRFFLSTTIMFQNTLSKYHSRI